MTLTFPQAPLFIPDGRISRVRLATMAFPHTAFPTWPKLKCWLTYAPHHIGLLFGSCCKFCYPPYSGTAPWGGFLPTPPCAESPFAQNQALPAFATMSCIMSDGVTHPSSLILAHAPDQIPPAVFDSTITTGLCRLSPVPAGRWVGIEIRRAQCPDSNSKQLILYPVSQATSISNRLGFDHRDSRKPES